MTQTKAIQTNVTSLTVFACITGTCCQVNPNVGAWVFIRAKVNPKAGVLWLAEGRRGCNSWPNSQAFGNKHLAIIRAGGCILAQSCLHGLAFWWLLTALRVPLQLMPRRCMTSVIFSGKCTSVQYLRLVWCSCSVWSLNGLRSSPSAKKRKPWRWPPPKDLIHP